MSQLPKFRLGQNVQYRGKCYQVSGIGEHSYRLESFGTLVTVLFSDESELS